MEEITQTPSNSLLADDIDGNGVENSDDQRAMEWIISGKKICPPGITCDLDNNNDIDAVDYGFLGKLSNCDPVIQGQNNPNEKRINIFFIGKGYKDIEVAHKFTKEAVNQLLTAQEPFRSNKEKFNFWFITKPVKGDAHTEPWVKKCVSQYQIKGPRFIVNFLNSKGVSHADFNKPSNVMTKRCDSACPSVAIHELGHSFGDLDDEYDVRPFSDAGTHSRGYIPFVLTATGLVSTGRSDSLENNCRGGSKADCLDPKKNKRWGDLLGMGCGDPTKVDCLYSDLDYFKEVSCFSGCRYEKKYFRPHEESIMKIPIAGDFGIVHQRQLCQRIKKLTGSSGGICLTIPKPS